MTSPEPDRGSETRAVRVTAALLLCLLVLATLGRLALDAAAPAPADLVAPLLGVAGLCVLGLALGRSASVAWLACLLVATATAATLAPLWPSAATVLADGSPGEGVHGAGLVPGSSSTDAWGVPAVALALGRLVRATLIAPLAVAAGYAAAPSRRLAPWVPAVAWIGVTVVGVGLLAGMAQTLITGAVATVGVPRVAWIAGIAALGGLGIAGDLAPAVGRVRGRLAQDASLARGPVGWLRLLADELLPGRATTRAEAAETERGRLASELHAEVLPALRSALAAAEAGGSAERLAAQLRVAVDDVERLLVARRLIVLEELGLVAALEWLAERTEERSSVSVELLVDAPSGGAVAGPTGRPDRPPRPVERTAFRVAQLALDNVVRHAPGARAVVRIVAGADSVLLAIRDDGPGMAMDASADIRAGGRGLVDMRAEADDCGATLVIGPGTGGHGTEVRFAWPRGLRDGP